MVDEIIRQLYVACQVYLTLTYNEQILTIRMDEIFNKMIDLLFNLERVKYNLTSSTKTFMILLPISNLKFVKVLVYIQKFEKNEHNCLKNNNEMAS